MTIHPKAGVEVTPNVNCQNCGESMDNTDGMSRVFICENCDKKVAVDGDYDVVRLV